MLCGQCKVITDGVSDAHDVSWRRVSMPDQLTALLCARCGTVLPNPDPDGIMLTKLTQLSRFGLGADDRPLLEPDKRVG